MPDISDHELDKLFQEAAAGIKPKFDPEDWKRLASRLDGGGKTSFAREISLYSVAALLLLTSFWPGLHQHPASQQAATLSEQTAADTEVHSTIDEIDKTAPSKIETIVAPDHTKQDTGAPNDKASPKEQLQASSSPSAARLSEDATASEAGNSNTKRDKQKNTSTLHARNGVTKDNTRKAKSGLAESTYLSVEATSDRDNNTSTGSGRAAENTAIGKDRAPKATSGQTESASRYAETNTNRNNSTSTKPGHTAVENKNISKDSTLEIASSPVKNIPLHTKTTTDQNDGVSAESNHALLKNVAVSKDSTQKATSVSTKGPLLFAETNTHRDNNTSTIPGSTSSEKRTSNNDSTREATASVRTENKSFPAKTNAEQDSIASTGSVRAAFENNTITSLPGKKNSEGDSSAYYTKIERKGSKGSLTAPDSLVVETNSSKVLAATLPSDSSQIASPAEKEKEDKTRSQWFLKLPVSPDFTSIDYGKPGKPGLNIGLLVEFMPGKHFSVSTGAIWSRKIYSTADPGANYTWNGHTAKIDLLDGDCRVLDLPINVTYYLPVGPRTSFFASAGFSSYIMLKEKYDYTIIANNRDYHYHEDITRKNNEWFSMLNLSIGIQHQIGERFWFQAEPFLKAPIAGVGEGKVDLVSMGAFFSLKYQLRK